MSRRPLFLKFRKYTGSISLFPLLWQILKYPVAITFPFPVGNNDIPVSSPGSFIGFKGYFRAIVQYLEIL